MIRGDLCPSDSPTRSLARRCAGALRSRGSLRCARSHLSQQLPARHASLFVPRLRRRPFAWLVSLRSLASFSAAPCPPCQPLRPPVATEAVRVARFAALARIFLSSSLPAVAASSSPGCDGGRSRGSFRCARSHLSQQLPARRGSLFVPRLRRRPFAWLVSPRSLASFSAAPCPPWPPLRPPAATEAVRVAHSLPLARSAGICLPSAFWVYEIGSNRFARGGDR